MCVRARAKKITWDVSFDRHQNISVCIDAAFLYLNYLFDNLLIGFLVGWAMGKLAFMVYEIFIEPIIQDKWN